MEISLADKILELIKAKDITASRLFENAGIDRMSGLEIINAGQYPVRDVLLRISIGLGISPEETQDLLRDNGYPPLSPDDERDSYILFALKNGGDVDGLNESLYSLGFDKLER